MMFLPDDKWSPRYDAHFYTLCVPRQFTIYLGLDRIAGGSTEADDPFGDDDACAFCRPAKYPAVYYEIEVRRGTKSHTVLRRYSHFRRLCQKLDPTGEKGLLKDLPPRTGPFHNDSDNKFREGRREGLYAFLNETLVRPECVGNPVVERFLGLSE
ncbi:hypothetical protein ACHAXT_003989 [Thalassiosira profunda]